MIVYDLECRDGQHRFEGWFKSSEDFKQQQGRALVTCPYCGSANVGKAMQAPRLARKGNQLPDRSAPDRTPVMPKPAQVPTAPVMSAPLPPEAMEMMQKLAQMQVEALKESRFVGDSFADDARAMHYGEREVEPIHGQTTLDEAMELIDEGVAVMPLPFSILPPDKTN